MEPVNTSGIIHNSQLRNWVDQTVAQIISYMNAGGMLLGAIAANAIDVIFGGVMMGIALQHVDVVFGAPIDGIIFAALLSLAFLFVQTLLWDMVWNDQKVTISDALPFLLAILIAFVDTNIDTAPIYSWLMQSTVLNDMMGTLEIFGKSVMDIVVYSIIGGAYIVMGCTELFNVWYIRRRRIILNSTKSTRKQSRPVQQRVPTYQPTRGPI